VCLAPVAPVAACAIAESDNLPCRADVRAWNQCGYQLLRESNPPHIGTSDAWQPCRLTHIIARFARSPLGGAAVLILYIYLDCCLPVGRLPDNEQCRVCQFVFYCAFGLWHCRMFMMISACNIYLRFCLLLADGPSSCASACLTVTKAPVM